MTAGSDRPGGFGRIDFLDLGASSGGSFVFAKEHLGGMTGLGIDLDSKKVAEMQTKGFDAQEGDATALDLPTDSVRFVIMSHFLEHLPSLSAVTETLRGASRVARDFLFIQGPVFDSDSYLASFGLGFYWSNWSGHTCHLTITDLTTILRELGLDNHVVMVSGKIKNSKAPAVLPVGAPRNQHDYDPEKHPSKAVIRFDHHLFSEFVCLVRLRPFADWDRLVRTVRRAKRAKDLVRTTFGERLLGERFIDRIPTPSQIEDNRLVFEITKRLLIHRRLEYLRALHLHAALRGLPAFKSVLVVSADRGYAGIFVAAQDPITQWRLADFRPQTDTRFAKSKELVEAWNLNNVTIEDIDPVEGEQEFDVVVLLQGFEEAGDAAAELDKWRRIAGSSLVVFLPLAAVARDEEAADEGEIPQRKGFTLDEVDALFPKATEVRGCYWDEWGAEFPARLEGLTDVEIVDQMTTLVAAAADDLVDERPDYFPESLAVVVTEDV